MTDRRLARRDFLRLGAAAGSALVAGCAWEGGPLRPALGAMSRINDWVGEHLILSSDRLAREYPVSQRSGARFPNYHLSRDTPLLSDPSVWSLQVGGEVRKPTRLTLDLLQGLPRISYTVKHHCVEGWTAIATWTGVPVSAVAALVEPTERARYLRFDSFDRTPDGVPYYNGWDLKSAMHPQTILAYACDDQPITPEHGAPLRLYSPLKLGYKLTKYLTGMTFTSTRPGGYWEDQGYPWLAGI